MLRRNGGIFSLSWSSFFFLLRYGLRFSFSVPELTSFRVAFFQRFLQGYESVNHFCGCKYNSVRTWTTSVRNRWRHSAALKDRSPFGLGRHTRQPLLSNSGQRIFYQNNLPLSSTSFSFASSLTGASIFALLMLRKIKNRNLAVPLPRWLAWARTSFLRIS